MKLTQKIYVGFAIPAVLLVGIGAYSLYSFSRIAKGIETIYDDRVVPLEQLKEISDNYAVHIIDAVNKANDERMSLTEALQLVTEARETIDETWGTYLATELTPEEQALASEVEELFRVADEEIDELVNVLQSGNLERLEAYDGELYSVIDPLTAKIQELIALQLEVAGEEREAAERLYNSTIAMFLVLLIFAVILASPLGFLISRTITSAFQDLINTVATASSQIATATEEQERIASQQASSVNETTATMEELRSSARQLAEQAEVASAEAQEALLLTDNGNQTVGKTLEEMSLLKDKVSAIAKQILHLSEQTGQIGSISALVSNLANQTNMLALNAAVEAVRAGEQGKGFGVVASEIRKLADQSRKSAEKINTLVEDVQTAINSTVMATDEGTQSVEKGVQMSQETSQVFAGIADSVNNVVITNQQISLNVKQQSTAIEQVTDAMNAINQGAQETASGISQTKQGTHRLSDAARNLQEVV